MPRMIKFSDSVNDDKPIWIAADKIVAVSEDEGPAKILLDGDAYLLVAERAEAVVAMIEEDVVRAAKPVFNVFRTTLDFTEVISQHDTAEAAIDFAQRFATNPDERARQHSHIRVADQNGRKLAEWRRGEKV